jgi:hypothetical protein
LRRDVVSFSCFSKLEQIEAATEGVKVAHSMENSAAVSALQQMLKCSSSCSRISNFRFSGSACIVGGSRNFVPKKKKREHQRLAGRVGVR